MSEWYARDISKKVKTGIKTKGANGKPVATEAPYGYIKDPENKDYWIVDREAAEVVKLIFRLFMEEKQKSDSRLSERKRNTNPNLLYETTRQRNSQKQTSQ